MGRNLCYRWIAISAMLLFSLGANAQERSHHLREIFVPQTSEFMQQHPGVIQSFDLSPDGKTLAVEFGAQEAEGKKVNGWLPSDAWVALWDVDGQRLIGATEVDRNVPAGVLWYTHGIRFSPNGRMLLVLTGPRLVALSFPQLKILYAIEDRVTVENIQNQMFIEGFSMAANRLAILEQYDHNSGHSSSLKMKIADLDTGRVIAQWAKPGLSRSIAFSPDAKLLALTINPAPWGYRDIPAGANNVFIVKPDSGEVVRAFNSGYAVGNVEFVGGDTALMTMPMYSAFDPRDAAQVWDLKTGGLRQKLGYPKYGLRGGMALSANGELLAVAAIWLNPTDVRLDRDNPRGYARLLLWSLPTGTLEYSSHELGQEYNFGGLPMNLSWGLPSPPVLVRMSASGNRLAVGGGLISVYSVEAAPARPRK
jgi:WD40 repeat protein